MLQRSESQDQDQAHVLKTTELETVIETKNSRYD